jgi:hypothetical protein
MAASVSKSCVPDYFRCHISECTQIPPEPLNLLCELRRARVVFGDEEADSEDMVTYVKQKRAITKRGSLVAAE